MSAAVHSTTTVTDRRAVAARAVDSGRARTADSRAWPYRDLRDGFEQPTGSAGRSVRNWPYAGERDALLSGYDASLQLSRPVRNWPYAGVDGVWNRARASDAGPTSGWRDAYDPPTGVDAAEFARPFDRQRAAESSPTALLALCI